MSKRACICDGYEGLTCEVVGPEECALMIEEKRTDMEPKEERRPFVVEARFSTLAAAEAFARKIERKYLYMQVAVNKDA